MVSLRFALALACFALALCIQAMTNDADLAEMGGEDESVGLGRRGGGEILRTSGSFVLSANRAGNDEEELGDTDTPLAPTGKDEIAKLKTLVNANVQSEPMKVGAVKQMSPDVKSRMRDTADQAEQERSSLLLDLGAARGRGGISSGGTGGITATLSKAGSVPKKWDGKCHSSCTTCIPPNNPRDTDKACTSCADQSHKLVPQDKVMQNGKAVQVGYCWDGKTCYTGSADAGMCKTCSGKTYRDCTSCADQLKVGPGKLVMQNGKAVRSSYCWDGKTCHKSCKTCSGKLSSECTSCAEGTLLAARKFTESIARPFKVPSGQCLALKELKDFSPSSGGVMCSYSACTDGATGLGLGMGALDSLPTDWKLVCSRICLMGGRLTKVANLRRYDNPESKTGERLVDEKFAGLKVKSSLDGTWSRFSSPVCALHKTTMCTKNKAFDIENCKRFKKDGAKDGAKAKHCTEKNCDVQKAVSCVAILPDSIKTDGNKYGVGPLLHAKELGTDLSAYMNECKHAIDPCGSLPMLV